MANRFNGAEVGLSLVIRQDAQFWALLDAAVDELARGIQPRDEQDRLQMRKNWENKLLDVVREKVGH